MFYWVPEVDTLLHMLSCHQKHLQRERVYNLVYAVQFCMKLVRMKLLCLIQNHQQCFQLV
jgi:hypothetical protein